MSPGNLNSSLRFIQPSILHDVLCIYAKKLIELCKEIAEDYSPEDIDEMGDDEDKENE